MGQAVRESAASRRVWLVVLLCVAGVQSILAHPQPLAQPARSSSPNTPDLVAEAFDAGLLPRK